MLDSGVSVCRRVLDSACCIPGDDEFNSKRFRWEVLWMIMFTYDCVMIGLIFFFLKMKYLMFARVYYSVNG